MNSIPSEPKIKPETQPTTNERKNTDDLTSKNTLNGQKIEKRTEYPGYYLTEGDFNKEENERKSLRFNTKNKTLFDEAVNNLK